MADIKEYLTNLSEALQAKRDWLEKTELANLKEQLRVYQSSFASLYSIFLKKKLIHEDPYKHEAKIGELEVPETGAFNDAKRLEQLSLRISDYDNQLDFLVNFYQLGVDHLSLEHIKRILALIRYIDWNNLTPDSQSPNTKALAEIAQQSKAGLDQIVLSIVGESLTKLPKCTNAITGILKNMTAYHREFYKYNVRNNVTQNMSQAEAVIPNIKKKFQVSMPGSPFYQELVEEIIKEDYSAQGPALRENVLKSLMVVSEKPKTVKTAVSFKSTLIDGIKFISSAAPTLGEIAVKLNENKNLIENQKKSVWEKIKLVFRQMVNSEPEEHIIDIEYMDPAKGVPVKQKINFNQFCLDMDKKIKNYSGMNSYGSTATRLEAMSEEQIVSLLEKAIREIQILHRTLGALDEYFKAEAPRELRDRIKGIRPELATIKNTFIKANQARHEYSARKEEEEQMKRLGINPGA